MPDISFENVAPLIAEVNQLGRAFRYTFRCPVSGATFQASYTFPVDNSVGSRMGAQAKRSAMYEVRRAFSMAVRSMFGSNAVGRIAGDMANQAMNAATQSSGVSQPSFSDSDRQAAAVAAFQTVARQFVWDGQNRRWISARAAAASLSPFERQMAEAPVNERYDRMVLSRMLVEVANADGFLAQEESDFLLEFLDPDAGSVASLSQRPPLTASELAETSTGAVRDTLLMLAAVLALTDEDFSEAERAKLDAMAAGLGLAGARKNDVMRKAQVYILDNAMEAIFAHGHDERARGEIYALADRLGMDRRSASTAEAQFLKRRGV